MSDDLRQDQLARILDGAETIEQSLARLADVSEAVDRAEYKRDADLRDLVERRFVKMTEAALAIGRVIVVHERGEPAKSHPATMRSLQDLGVISDPLASEMEDAARFRNVLAHTYGDAIDHDVVYDALDDLKRYREFVVAVRDYLYAIDALE